MCQTFVFFFVARRQICQRGILLYLLFARWKTELLKKSLDWLAAKAGYRTKDVASKFPMPKVHGEPSPEMLQYNTALQRDALLRGIRRDSDSLDDLAKTVNQNSVDRQTLRVQELGPSMPVTEIPYDDARLAFRGHNKNREYIHNGRFFHESPYKLPWTGKGSPVADSPILDELNRDGMIFYAARPEQAVGYARNRSPLGIKQGLPEDGYTVPTPRILSQFNIADIGAQIHLLQEARKEFRNSQSFGSAFRQYIARKLGFDTKPPHSAFYSATEPGSSMIDSGRTQEQFAQARKNVLNGTKPAYEMTGNGKATPLVQKTWRVEPDLQAAPESPAGHQRLVEARPPIMTDAAHPTAVVTPVKLLESELRPRQRVTNFVQRYGNH